MAVAGGGGGHRDATRTGREVRDGDAAARHPLGQAARGANVVRVRDVNRCAKEEGRENCPAKKNTQCPTTSPGKLAGPVCVRTGACVLSRWMGSCAMPDSSEKRSFSLRPNSSAIHG